MNANAPQKKSGLGTIILAIVLFAAGFAAGHLVADFNLFNVSSYSRPETTTASDTSSSRENEEIPVEEEAQKLIDDANEAIEEVQKDAESSEDKSGDGDGSSERNN